MVRIKTPLKAACQSSLPLGNCAPRTRAAARRMDPEIKNLAAISTKGGKLSKLMRIPRYVVPQKKHTAARARYARNAREIGKSQGSIA
jgi:hypothetical protein